MIEKLVLATHNKGKIAEFAALLDGLVGEVVCAADFGLDAPEETGTTFVENATIKALAVAKATGLPSLADDSGMCVAALDGEPGVYSADWAGPEKDFQKAMTMVHERMGDASDNSSNFTSVLVLAFPDLKAEIFEGRVDGHILWPPRGSGGFGYDPMFVPEGAEKTFGEMTADEKRAVSHRAKAVEKLKAWFVANK